MSNTPKEAYDNGYRDGVRAKIRAKNSKESVFSIVLGAFLHGNSYYKGDKDYPESYREGFEEGKNSK